MEKKTTNQCCFQAHSSDPTLYLLFNFLPNPNNNTNVFVLLFAWNYINIGPFLGSLDTFAPLAAKNTPLLSGICENESKNFL